MKRTREQNQNSFNLTADQVDEAFANHRRRDRAATQKLRAKMTDSWLEIVSKKILTAVDTIWERGIPPKTEGGEVYYELHIKADELPEILAGPRYPDSNLSYLADTINELQCGFMAAESISMEDTSGDPIDSSQEILYVMWKTLDPFESSSVEED